MRCLLFLLIAMKEEVSPKGGEAVARQRFGTARQGGVNRANDFSAVFMWDFFSGFIVGFCFVGMSGLIVCIWAREVLILVKNSSAARFFLTFDLCLKSLPRCSHSTLRKRRGFLCACVCPGQ
jgi:hypothetical protein